MASKRPPTSSKEPPGSLKTLSEMPPRHLFKWFLQNVMRELTLHSQSKKLAAKESLLWTWNKSKLKELNTFSELSLFLLQVGKHFVFSHDFEQGAFSCSRKITASQFMSETNAESTKQVHRFVQETTLEGIIVSSTILTLRKGDRLPVCGES